jgi:hypothetical protein
MRAQYIEVTGTQEGVNFDGRFKVKNSPGIAYYLLGWSAEYRPSIIIDLDEDGEEIETEFWDDPELCRTDDDRIVAVMVGDDQRWTIDKSDLTEIDEEDYCGSCGQIGCGWC